ncbi:MAG: hypothetical protein A2Y40_05220 [Candidatus Margulisbacteria bacterium GWF2_35_9]|nr:MAG: hypothetical protein A2Y40_05220 [Candidatus Margulisbacteria bacterium GWF2_35_9]
MLTINLTVEKDVSIITFNQDDVSENSSPLFEIDFENGDQFESFFNKQIAKGIRNALIDLSNISYIYSYGISIFFNFYKELKYKGGHFKLLNPSVTLQKLLDSLRVSAFIEIYKDKDSALKSFKI